MSAQAGLGRCGAVWESRCSSGWGGRSWPDRGDEIERLLAAGLSLRDVADKLDMPLRATRKQAAKRGPPPGRLGPRSAEAEGTPGFLDALGTASDGDVGKRFGFSRKITAAARRRHGTAPWAASTNRRRLDRAQIQSLLEQGASDPQIAERLDTSPKTIATIRQTEFPALNRSRALSKLDVRAIAASRASARRTAEIFGISESAVRRIRRREAGGE